MNIAGWAGLIGAVLLAVPATGAAQQHSAAQGVVYRCVQTDGGVTYTNIPAVGCTVQFTFTPSQWRIVASGGHGSAAWKIYVNESWRNLLPVRGGEVVWIYAAPRERPLTGETYKSLLEHVSAECSRSRLTVDSRTFFQDKPGGKALTPDNSMQTVVAPMGSPAASLLHEFCT